MNKYGLILAGGGAKGIYQLGAWKAMREMGIEFEAIAGVSIGSINGAFIAADDYDKACEFWNTAAVDKGVRISRELKDPENLLSYRNIPALLKEVVENKGIDASPTKDFLSEYIDEEKIRESGIDLGIVSFSLSNFEPFEKFIEDIPEGQFVDYLLASSKIPGVSKVGPEGERYLDGGFYDNAPVGMMFRQGYTRLIVVDISNMKGLAHRDEFSNCEMIFIKPFDSEELGGAMDFTPELNERRKKMGYLDAKKAFGQLSGRIYYFGKGVFREMVKKYGAEVCEQLEEIAYELGLEILEVYEPDEFIAKVKELCIDYLEEQNKKLAEQEQKFYAPLLKRLPKFKAGKTYNEAIAVLEDIVV